jgi:hypothetical protein
VRDLKSRACSWNSARLGVVAESDSRTPPRAAAAFRPPLESARTNRKQKLGRRRTILLRCRPPTLSDAGAARATQPMAHVNSRQWQRFTYRADVQLGWQVASAAVQRIQSGAVVDLSLGGMLVRAHDAPEVGAVVSCRVAWSGRWFTLPGRVRWRKTEPQPSLPNEIGIEFGPLSVEQTQRVRELVAGLSHGEQRVQLHLARLSEPFDALALPTGFGVRLRVALPWFARGSELDFDLKHTNGKFAGRVTGASLVHADEPDRLEVELRLEPRRPTRARRYTMYEAPDEVIDGFALAGRREPELTVPKARAARLIVLGLTLLVVGTVGMLAAGRVWQSERNGPTVRSLGKPESAGDSLGQSATETSVSSASVPPANAASNPTLKAPPAAAASVTDQPPSKPSDAPADLKRAFENHGAASPTHADEPPAAEGGDEPSLRVNGDTSEVIVPVIGSLAGARTALWVEPRALVVDLPQAQFRLSKSRYALSGGGVAALSVGKNHGTPEVRVLLDELLARYSTQEVPGGLLIRMKRDLHPMP